MLSSLFPMSKALKITAVSLAGLLVLGAIGVGVLVLTFDPNDYKPWLIRYVQDKKQRTLTIPGDITMTFYPKIDADLGEVHLSERQGAQEFAAVKSAKVSLALLPLLSKQLVVDRIMVDGLRANLVRHADGTTNFDDLLNEEAADAELRFDIAGVSLSNAAVRYDDQLQQRTLEFSQMDLETDRLARQAASRMELSAQVRSNQPEAQLKIELTSALEYDLDHQHFIFKDADGRASGQLGSLKALALKFSGNLDLKPEHQRFVMTRLVLDGSATQGPRTFAVKLHTPGIVVTDAIVSGSELDATVNMQEGARALSVKLSLPKFEGTPGAFQVADMSLEARFKQEGLDAKAKLSGPLAGNLEAQSLSSSGLQMVLSGRQGGKSLAGTLNTPLSANFKTQQIELSQLVTDLSLPNPGGGLLQFKAKGRASIDLARQLASAQLQGKVDDSSFDAQVNLKDFSAPAYEFDVGIDRLHLARYRRQEAPDNKAAQAGKQPDVATAIDLSMLKDVNAEGSLRIGQLISGKLSASEVALKLRAAQSTLAVTALSAQLYGGSVQGSLSAAAGSPQRFTLKQHASNIHVGPLLRDTLDQDTLEGRGDVSLDLRATGATVDQLMRSLAGSAGLQLRDGSVRGINLAQTVRQAKTQINALQGKPAAQAGTGTKAEKTDFTELTASFRIAQGIARNTDLHAKSPLLRLGGAGTINLPQERLDYRLDTTIASTLKGQGGPELEELKGLTIPVQLSGPWSAIQWKVDVAGMAEEAVKHKLDEKKDELREKAKDKLRHEFQGLFGR